MFLLLALCGAPTIAAAQAAGRAEVFLYLVDEDTYVQPVVTLDRGALHLEARYQYEDRETGSAWAGWSLATGTELELTAVPMIGILVGRTEGWAPGLEASLSWRRFELYSENEYVFDVEGSEGDFFYSWSQLGWDAAPWLTVGLSAQRTRLYEGDADLERGIFAAARRGAAELTLFGFGLGGDDAFAILALGVEF